MTFLMKKLVLSLAEHGMDYGWRDVAAFPFLFMEDLVPFYIFSDS